MTILGDPTDRLVEALATWILSGTSDAPERLEGALYVVGESTAKQLKARLAELDPNLKPNLEPIRTHNNSSP